MSLFNFEHRTARLALAAAALAIVGGAIGAGCGGGYDTSTLGGFCQALAASDCTPPVVMGCYSASEAMLETDTNSCIIAASRTSKCNPQNLPYHADYAGGCIDMHAQVYAADTIDRETYKQLDQACLPVFNKGGRAGTACSHDSDCDVGNGLNCMVRVGGKGTCRIPTPVEAGQSCKDPAAQCPAGMFCDVSFHCISLPGADEACGAGQPCADGFRCNNAEHKCVSQLPDGSKCKGDSDCAGGFCLGIGVGDSATGMCGSALRFTPGSTVCSAYTNR